MSVRRHPLRNLLIGCGITLVIVAGSYLVAGLSSLNPPECSAVQCRFSTDDRPTSTSIDFKHHPTQE